VVAPIVNALKADFRFKENPLLFIDGPTLDNTEDSLCRSSDYNCTAVGFPAPRNHKVGRTLVWLLDEVRLI
jgi:hypothetical protein